MINEQEKVLIMTVRIDEESEQFFNALRTKHFPANRNFLKAHLTLFHKLRDDEELETFLSGLSAAPFQMRVSGLINLGAGVAFRVESEQLTFIRAQLSAKIYGQLSAQDRQGFRGHITVPNKTSPEIARALLAELSNGFTPFDVNAIGLDLWYYLGGPWAHKQFFPFSILSI